MNGECSSYTELIDIQFRCSLTSLTSLRQQDFRVWNKLTFTIKVCCSSIQQNVEDCANRLSQPIYCVAGVFQDSGGRLYETRPLFLPQYPFPRTPTNSTNVCVATDEMLYSLCRLVWSMQTGSTTIRAAFGPAFKATEDYIY